MAWTTGIRIRLAVQNFTSIGAGGANTAPNIKKFHFLEEGSLAGANPLTDFLNFSPVFIRLTILH